MKTLIVIPLAICVMLAMLPTAMHAQDADSTTPTFSEKKLDGPRLGLTYIPGNSSLSRTLEKSGLKNVVSQFGWHFEWIVAPEGGGPQFVVQFVPLVAGVEYGKFLANGTLGLGIRLPSGIEFGMGPNMLITGDGIRTGLMGTVGKSFNYGGVSIPINVVVVTNPDGNRFGLMFGYAIMK